MNDPKNLSKERFNQYAAGYVTNKTHAKGAELDRLVEIAQPQSNWKVLDVATGGGHTALKFAPYVAHVLVTDLTPNMLEAARKHITGQGITNVAFELADAEELPFDANNFDLVTCRIAPHHFPNIGQFVQKAARLLKPGGLLLVQDQVVPEDTNAARYVDAFEKLRDPSHNRVFSEAEWVDTFRQANLNIEHLEQLTKQHDLIQWAQMQGNTPETIEMLRALLRNAPAIAAAWLQAHNIDQPDATFVNHHIIIAGRKSQ